MQDTQTGELKSIAYNRLYYPEDSFGIAKDAKVAIEIAKSYLVINLITMQNNLT